MLSTIALLTMLAGPTQPPDTLTVRDVKGYYQDVFAVESNDQGQTYFLLASKDFVLPHDHPLAELVAGNQYFFAYLVKNWSTASGRLGAFAGETEFPRNFYAALQADSSFNELLLPIVARWLKTRNGALAGFESDDAPRAVPMQRALDIAVRFFYADGVSSDGSLEAHVCVGINGLLDLEGERDPYVESLAYMGINKEMLNSKHGIVEAFLEVYSRANNFDLSTDADTKVLRAQGMMWAGMYEKPALREALVAEQARIGAWLPIRIEG